MTEFCSRCPGIACHRGWCYFHKKGEPLCEDCYQEGLKCGKIVNQVRELTNESQYI